MEIANKLELHYYFNDDTHEIDAIVRNKCEAELLAIISEVASILDIDANIISEAIKEGGVREFWKIFSNNAAPITVLLLLSQLLITAIPLLDSEKEELEKELSQLKVEETKLNIQKLKKELKDGETNTDTAKKTADHLSKNLKIIKRKSNFYTLLSHYKKVSTVGFSVLNANNEPINNEKLVARRVFKNYILSTNKLKAEEIEAEIEIISPVLKEGRYKWKGIYQEQPINFEMLDLSFKDSVLLDNLPFQHGTKILCVLRVNRELNEVGDVTVTGYAVTTVIEKIDEHLNYKTPQGKKYRHSKKLMEGQGDLFS